MMMAATGPSWRWCCNRQLHSLKIITQLRPRCVRGHGYQVTSSTMPQPVDICDQQFGHTGMSALSCEYGATTEDAVAILVALGALYADRLILRPSQPS